MISFGTRKDSETQENSLPFAPKSMRFWELLPKKMEKCGMHNNHLEICVFVGEK